MKEEFLFLWITHKFLIWSFIFVIKMLNLIE